MFNVNNILINNGFLLASLGFLIVFLCIILLAGLIFLFHKFITSFEYKKYIMQHSKNDPLFRKNSDFQRSVLHSAEQVRSLISIISKDSSFPLPKLLKLAIERGILRPHFTISKLIDFKVIEPDKKGYFILNKDIYKKLINYKG